MVILHQRLGVEKMPAFTWNQAGINIILSWVLTFLVFILLLFRVYARVRFNSKYRYDDYCFILAFFFDVSSHASWQTAVFLAFTQSERNIDRLARNEALVYTSICIFGLGTIFAKAAIGLFLVRLALELWQKRLIWGCILFCGLVSSVETMVLLFRCRPLVAAWDMRVSGHCLDTKAMFMVYFVTTILVDLCFAILPWVMVWNLHKPRREKMIIAGSLSLGILPRLTFVGINSAAAAGLWRIVLLMNTVSLTPPMAVASTMEQSLTLIGVGIPASMPVYRAWYKACTGNRRRPSTIKEDSQIAQLTIGGHHMPGSKPKPLQRMPSLWDIHKVMSITSPDIGHPPPALRHSSAATRDDERTLCAEEEGEAARQHSDAPRPASLHLRLGSDSPPKGG